MPGTVHLIAATVGPMVATVGIIADTFTHHLARTRLKSDTFRLSLDGTAASA
jgi:hypothetical protein